jgi:lysyl-tRNA synthetase class 1
MYLKPKTAKRMHFDVIPKAVDEYHQQLRAYATQDTKARLNNPVWHIHAGDVPESDMVVPFSMLLNLASASSAEDKETMWGFINKYAPDATPQSNPTMDQAAGFAVAYFNDYVKPTKVFRAPSDQERVALQDLADALKSAEAALAAIAKKNDILGKDEPLPEADFADEEFLQSVVFAIGKIHGFEPLRDWFTAIYEVLLGASQGPRFGGFIALYGVDETIALIDRALMDQALAD